MPNPPVPNELKRRRGNPGKRALTPAAQVVRLPRASGVPEPPSDLGLEGQQLWARAWTEAIVWLSPQSDIAAVEQACYLLDDLATARECYRTTRDPVHGRMVVNFSKELQSALSALGFNPTARTRLGVAEVTRVSKLDALRRQK